MIRRTGEEGPGKQTDEDNQVSEQTGENTSKVRTCK